MSENSNNNGLIDEAACERYLFGEMSDEEQETFEESYFTDDAFFERFVAVKTELVDLYARGELPSEKRARMEPHFMATVARKKQVTDSHDFIRAVTTISDRDRVSIDPGPTVGFFGALLEFFTLPRLVTASILLVALTGGIFLIRAVWKDGRSTDQAFEAQPAVDSPPNQQNENSVFEVSASNSEGAANQPSKDQNSTQQPFVAAESKSPIPESSSSRETLARPKDDEVAVANNSTNPPPQDKDFDLTISSVGRDDAEPSLTLRMGSTRAPGPGNTLSLRSASTDQHARLILLFRSEDYSKFRVSIATVQGGNVFSSNYTSAAVRKEKDGDRRLTVALRNGRVLQPRDYIVKLEGVTRSGAIETIGEYYFNVRAASK